MNGVQLEVAMFGAAILSSIQEVRTAVAIRGSRRYKSARAWGLFYAVSTLVLGGFWLVSS